MIQLRNLTNPEMKHTFTLSKFPDGTSQAWQITPEPNSDDAYEVLWMFEGDAEMMAICQLGDLLYLKYKIFPVLTAPWLPYGRQDKGIANDATFGRSTFINLIIQSGYTRINSYDVHSFSSYVHNIHPEKFFNEVIQHGEHDIIVFPDAGAMRRYEALALTVSPYIPHALKTRDQLTGEITGMELSGGFWCRDKKVLVMDDICDGGKTFIELMKEIKKFEPKSVDLAVSHGLFSKGLTPIYVAGYNKVYTTNSLLRNSKSLTGARAFEVSFLGRESFKVIDVVDYDKEDSK